MTMTEDFKNSQTYKEFTQADNRRNELSTPDSECRHQYWTKKCSTCYAILESECNIRAITGDYEKVIYHEFDSLVCTFMLSLRLQSSGVIQRSKLYWVKNTDTNSITLRAKENVTLRGSEVASAYTSSELCKHLYRINEELLTDEIYAYIGKNANDPDRLARLLLTLKSEAELD